MPFEIWNPLTVCPKCHLALAIPKAAIDQVRRGDFVYAVCGRCAAGVQLVEDVPGILHLRVLRVSELTPEEQAELRAMQAKARGES